MAKTVVVVIREDPTKTHRPVEALRIALGLVAGSHSTTVILLGQAIRLLSDDMGDIVDADILEKYLPSIRHLDIPFVLPRDTGRSVVDGKFRIRYESDDEIRSRIHSADRVLVF
ncbi:MAG: hypothetical protein NNA20_05580 [Nitrospira sp.]|nr:hypothetical protein [Nitrospira sp.]MCP9442045.1 hypothetical protein [Nitrospira sp.]